MAQTPYIKYKNLFVIPSFHSRIQFTRLVWTAFFKIFPDIIAVELPNNVREEVTEGIERLPFLSLIGYADELNPQKMNFIPIDPGDSIIEGIRLGLEHHIPVEFIDLSVKDYEPPILKLPDDYSLNKISLSLFYQKINEYFKDEFKEKKEEIRDSISLEDFLKSQENPVRKYDSIEKDVLREKYMASHLLNLMPNYRRILLVIGMAHWENIKFYLEHSEKIQDIELELEPHTYVEIFNIKGSDARFLLRELPYNTYQWTEFRKSVSRELSEEIETPRELFDILDSYNKLDNIRAIFLNSKDEYEKEFKEFVDLHRLKNIFQYSRNLALTENRLLPNLYHLIMSAKNIVDDDYAWKVLKEATKYPYDDDSEEYKTMNLSMEGGYDPNGRYIKLRRHHPYWGSGDKDVPLNQRPEEKYPGQWRDEWEESIGDTVSYPPEDIIEEDYFTFIRKKAMRNLKQKRVKIEEFKSSIMDGIAIKETIRNWAFKKKIYVRNEQQIQGKIDTIVVIFDEDDKEVEKYPFRLTWWAEHERESNMAFYATNPGEYLIGPGISHVEVGGLLSIFPPTRLQEIFQSYMDSEYRDAKNKAERLLKAAILYSKEKFIAYVADKPPRKYFFSLAGVKKREIVFIPLDHFNKESLKTIKHIHILAGRNKRRIAHNYIFLDPH
ncbi:MAG: hypothetical protein ACFFBI_03135 [Promethearchaeota archaeon]